MKLFVITLLFFLNMNSSLQAVETPDETNLCEQQEAGAVDGSNQEAIEPLADAASVIHQSCKNPDGSYKRESITIEGEQIDCQQVARQFYDLSTACEGANRQEIFQCITTNWEAQDRLDFFQQIQSDLGALEIKVEEHFSCEGKNQDLFSAECMQPVVCGLAIGAMTMIPGGSALVAGARAGATAAVRATAARAARRAAATGIASRVLNTLVPPSALQRIGQCAESGSNCLKEALWGIIQNVFSNVQGLWDIAKGVGTFVVDGFRRLVGFPRADDSVSDIMALASKIGSDVMSDGLFPTLGDLVTKFGRGLQQAITNGMRNNFACTRWEGGVAGTRIGSNARCMEAAPSFECATCEQKMQIACGTIGFAGGEIVTMLLTGGTVNVASRLGRATRVGRVALDATGSAMRAAGRGARNGMNVAGRAIGDSISNAAWTVRAGTSMAIEGSEFATKIVGKMGRGVGMVRGGANQFGALIGDSIIAFSPSSRARLVNAMRATGRVTRDGLAAYPRLLDEAYSLGRHGAAGKVALGMHGARGAEAFNRATEGSDVLRKTRLSPDETAFRGSQAGQEYIRGIEQAQEEYIRARLAYREAVKKARNAPDGAAQEAALREMDEAFQSFEAAGNTIRSNDMIYDRRVADFTEQQRAQQEAQRIAQANANNSQGPNPAAPELSSGGASAVPPSNQANRALSPDTNATSNRASTSDGVPSPERTAPDVSPNPDRTTSSTPEVRPFSRELNESIGNINYTRGERRGALNSMISNSDGANPRVYAWVDGQPPRRFDLHEPRIEGDYLVGTNRMNGNAASRIHLDDVDQFNFVSDVRSTNAAGEIITSQRTASFAFTQSADPQVLGAIDRVLSGASRTTDDIIALDRSLQALNQRQLSRVTAAVQQRVRQGVRVTEDEMFALLKNHNGLRTRPITNVEEWRQIFNMTNPDEAIAAVNSLSSSWTSADRRTIINDMSAYVRANAIASANARPIVNTAMAASAANSNIDDAARVNANTDTPDIDAPNRTSDVDASNPNRTEDIGPELPEGNLPPPSSLTLTSADNLAAPILRTGDSFIDAIPSPNLSRRRTIPQNMGSAGRTYAIAGGAGAILNNDTVSENIMGAGYTGLVTLDNNSNCLLQIKRDNTNLTSEELSALDLTVNWRSLSTDTELTRCSGLSCTLDATASYDNITNTFVIDGDSYTPSGQCNHIRITAPRNGVYEISTTYTASPPSCLANIEHSRRGDPEAVRITSTNLAARNTTVRWFKSDSEEASEQICAGSTETCALPSGVTTAYLKVYSAGVLAGSATCEASTPSAPGSTFNPLTDLDDDDNEDGDGNGDGIDVDMASRFYDQQRSPPPSLFQAAPIPRRPTHYLHSGYY